MDTSRAEERQFGIAALDQRSREIFSRLVDTYLQTGEPVGSRTISRVLPSTLSPASVRNVMTDLEEAGLIYSPHTSAGRLPTELGLRFYVDALLEVDPLASEERAKIDAQVAGSTGHAASNRSSPKRRRCCRACRTAPAWWSRPRST